ncbi:MAG TPA: hypothetical protein VK601_00280, partial [Kofleriaceae bacterium]|nr:hypothetical protein [Kofleriaceae bacterium]
GAVEQVSGTRMFARRGEGDRQILVYSMNVEIERELAMVLPLPVPPGGGDDAVQFIDLSGYPELFDDVARAFPERAAPLGRGASRVLLAVAREPLVVHDVGEFVASYVPSPADLDRLDPRFRIPRAVFASQAYDDWGFAVFQLKPQDRRRKQSFWRRDVQGEADAAQTIHPMAFSFPTRRPRALFFPTLHVHDGASVPDTARFDHTLVCQSNDELLIRTFGWQASDGPLGRHVSADRARGVIAPDAQAFQLRLDDELPNADHWFEPPRCSGLHVLSGRGERFAFELRALAAYSPEPAAGGGSPQDVARRDTARNRLDELHAGMMAGLAELTAARGDDWRLGAVTDEPGHRLNLSNNRAWRLAGNDLQYPEPGTPGSFDLAFNVRTDRVETQVIRLGFAAVPSPEIIEDIQRELAGVLDRAIAAR